MRSIHKYILEPNLRDRRITIEMPKSAKILSTSFRPEGVCVWAEIDVGAEQVDRVFLVLGTGWRQEAISPLATFVGTVFAEELVFHIYDLGEPGERDY